MGSHTREVVTLQLGHYANFVGTHWWNIQESSFVYNPSESEGPKEFNHDVLFREGQNLSGDLTFTPRLIAVDLKGSLNTLKQDGQLYNFAAQQYQDEVLWREDVTLHKTEATPKNEFLQDLDKLEEGAADAHDEKSSPESDRDESADSARPEACQLQKLYDLDTSVTVWSDFLRLHLHPKSIHLLQDYQHKNDLHRYDMFGYGRQMAAHGREVDDLDDRLHFFLEECDQLQGVHMLADTHDGFGGLGTSLLQHIQDDYGVRNVLLFGLTPPTFTNNTPMDHGYRILNSMMAYNELSSSGSAFIPLSTTSDVWHRSGAPVSLPHLDYKSDLWYHTSAILGSSVDTATLPYRGYTNPSLLSHLTDALTAGGRKVLGLQTSLPFPLKQSETLVDSFTALSEDPPWAPITPLYSGHVAPFSQSVVLRGISSSKIKGPITQSMPRDIQIAKSAGDVLEIYLRERFSNSLSAGCTVQQATKVTAPFPHIFSPNINRQGMVDVPRDKTIGVESVPMMTSMQASPSAVDLLEGLEKEARRLKPKKFNKLIESGVEEDDIEENFNSLQTLIQAYKSDTEAIY